MAHFRQQNILFSLINDGNKVKEILKGHRLKAKSSLLFREEFENKLSHIVKSKKNSKELLMFFNNTAQLQISKETVDNRNPFRRAPTQGDQGRGQRLLMGSQERRKW